MIPEMALSELKGGIETQTVSEELQVIQAELNSQADHLDEWREEMVQIIMTPLVDQDGDAKGDEFEESVNQQSKGLHSLILFPILY